MRAPYIATMLLAGLGVGWLLLRDASAAETLPDDENNLEPWRRAMLERARFHVAQQTPYQWGGGHHGPSWGLDCSGLINDCAKHAGFNADGWGSQKMWADLPHVEDPQPGDIACYAPRHVVLVERWDPVTRVAAIIGSNNGDASSTNRERSLEQGAFVQREPTQFYRSGFLGFATLLPLVK